MSQHNLDDILNTIRKCEQLAAEGRYRQAIHELRVLLERFNPAEPPEADLYTRIEDAIQQYQAQAVDVIADAIRWLRVSLRESADVLTLDFDYAENLLRQIEYADWQDAYTHDRALYADRLTYLRERELLQNQVQTAIEDCERLWTEAEANQRSERPLAPDMILEEYYDKARNIARAASSHIDHPDLKALVQEAEFRREDYALAAQVYTSARQSNLFRKALDDLDALPPNVLIPVYLFNEHEDGAIEQRYTGRQVTVQEARADLIAKARAWASRQALEYLKDAEDALEKKDPVTADKILRDGRPKVEEFIERDVREQLDDLQQKVNAALAELRAAEELAESPQAKEPIIFISYRRDDSAGYAGRLYDRLIQHFPKERLFMDIDDIPPGYDFVDVLENAIKACNVVLVIIGKQWVSIPNAEGKRRLDDPRDFVRIEVATALQRNVRVIPLLVGGAVMPLPAELPPDLEKLVRRQAVVINNHSFHPDVDRLIKALNAP